MSNSPRASIIYRPGVPALPPGVERYRIRGGGSIVVPIVAGDRFALTDVEGGQLCEIGFCDEQGTFDCGAFGASADSLGEGLRQVLTRDADDARRTRRALERRGVDPARASTLRVFGEHSAAGTKAEFGVSRNGLLAIAAPARPMDPSTHDTSTPIELRIHRHQPPDVANAVLPEPLADPLQDLRIRAGTASAYFVRAGEFIQVIDVAGRQCSDFQAFAARKLDEGKGIALDATVTRTLLGRSYPKPGLPSKAFDGEFEPLVEIVQDTVGRHDAFATACN